MTYPTNELLLRHNYSRLRDVFALTSRKKSERRANKYHWHMNEKNGQILVRDKRTYGQKND